MSLYAELKIFQIATSLLRSGINGNPLLQRRRPNRSIGATSLLRSGINGNFICHSRWGTLDQCKYATSLLRSGINGNMGHSNCNIKFTYATSLLRSGINGNSII